MPNTLHPTPLPPSPHSSPLLYEWVTSYGHDSNHGLLYTQGRGEQEKVWCLSWRWLYHNSVAPNPYSLMNKNMFNLKACMWDPLLYSVSTSCPGTFKHLFCWGSLSGSHHCQFTKTYHLLVWLQFSCRENIAALMNKRRLPTKDLRHWEGCLSGSSESDHVSTAG